MGWVEVQLYTFLTSALEEGGWSAPRPGRFTPRKDPVPIVQEAGWAPGPVWRGAKNLTSTGIRSPDRPARSQSLYRLSCLGPLSLKSRFRYPINFGVKLASMKKKKQCSGNKQEDLRQCNVLITKVELSKLYSVLSSVLSVLLDSNIIQFKQ
jgi:hypothetical protein